MYVGITGEILTDAGVLSHQTRHHIARRHTLVYTHKSISSEFSALQPHLHFTSIISSPCSCSLPHIHLIYISRAPCLSQHLSLIFIRHEFLNQPSAPHIVCVCVCETYLDLDLPACVLPGLPVCLQPVCKLLPHKTTEIDLLSGRSPLKSSSVYPECDTHTLNYWWA